MANMNCSACQDLQTDAPNFVVNGLGATEIASLKNNTGLSPSNGNNDCTDLTNMNDCLIGNLESELDAYDVCDWKEYTKNLTNNSWTMFGGIIAAVCGLWTNIKNLRSKVNGYDDRLDAMCALIDSLLSPPLSRYGTLLNSMGEQYPSHRGGVIAKKSGKDIVVPMAQSEVDQYTWDAQSIGIYHGTQRLTKCSTGACRMYEWIAPNMVGYRVNPDLNLEAGDLIWSATKAECMAWGLTERLWEIYTVSSWTWKDYGLSTNPRTLGWFRLSVDNNVMKLTYQGQVGGINTNANAPISESDNPARRAIYDC